MAIIEQIQSDVKAQEGDIQWILDAIESFGYRAISQAFDFGTQLGISIATDNRRHAVRVPTNEEYPFQYWPKRYYKEKIYDDDDNFIDYQDTNIIDGGIIMGPLIDYSRGSKAGRRILKRLLAWAATKGRLGPFGMN